MRCSARVATWPARTGRRRAALTRRGAILHLTTRLTIEIRVHPHIRRSTEETIMKLYGFPPSPNTWKVRAVAAHLGLPLDLEFVDLDQGAIAHAGLSGAQPDRPHAGAGRRRLQAVGVDRDHAVPRQPGAESALAQRRAHSRRHHALAKLAAAALEQGELRAADLRAAGEEVPEPGCARRRGSGQGHRELQPRSARARRPSRQATLPGRQGRRRSPTSRWRRRCSTPRKPSCRSRPMRTSATGSSRVSALPAWRETAPHAGRGCRMI